MNSHQYQMMLEPYRLPNGVLLKNRIEAAPSTLYFTQGPEPYPTEAMIVNLANRAKSGAGIVTVVGPKPIPDVDRSDPIMGHYACCFDSSDLLVQNSVAHLTNAIHCYNSKALIRFDIDKMIGDYDVSDGVESFWVEGNNSSPRFDLKAAPAEIMEAAAERYAEACLSFKNDMGFDGVWIHMAYRYSFLGRCLSPITNKRADNYGGNRENRFRFPLLVAKKVKEKCGSRFIVEGSISGHDPEGMDGATLEDTCAFARMAEGLFDILMIKAPEIDIAHPTQFDSETPWLYMAEAVKKAAPGVAVSASGGLFYPDTCEKILEEGKADMLAMARAFISNTNYLDKVKENRIDDIRPCLRCNKCHISSFKDPWISVCSVNPLIGMEHNVDHFIKAPGSPKKIAVIGGGTAGMEAALVSAKRGHQVTLYEKNMKLGGIINTVDGVDIKWTLTAFKDYLVRQIYKAPIRVLTGRAPSPDELIREEFDVVFAAVGSEPAIPPIKGIAENNVIPAVKAFQIADKLPERLVIIGGGEIGTEAGIYFSKKGKKVTVIELTDALAKESAPMHYRKMFKDVWESCESFSSITNAAVTEITENSVIYRLKDGSKHTVPADLVILSAGMKPLEEEALRYQHCAKHFFLLGDCGAPGNVQKALRSAYMLAGQF